MANRPHLLLVNPWISDFAAYDLWAKPLGLLLLASLLEEGGCEVSFIDCLDRHDPVTRGKKDLLQATHKHFHTGKYFKTPIPTPDPISDIPRRYYRYGIHPASLESRLEDIRPPDLILLTCIMTYWYPGAFDTIVSLRRAFPGVPIWLGGIYARLCADHARKHSGADEIFDQAEHLLPARLGQALGVGLSNPEAWSPSAPLPPPALELVEHCEYAPLLSSLGCPFNCPYCASSILQPVNRQRDPEALYSDIERWHTDLGVEDFAFYDDALVIDTERCLRPVLERLASQGPRVRFHTPNALHVRPLEPELCRLLKASGFETIRLGLETTRRDKQKKWGDKVDTSAFFEAVANLRSAGFDASQIGVYLMCGLPDQSVEEVAAAIEVVASTGARPHLCEFSPIPKTPVFEKACSLSRYDLETEPLTHNNSFFACRRPDFTYSDMKRLKDKIRLARKALRVI